MGEPLVIECRKAGKVYRALERGAGALGIAAGFFRRRVREHVALRDIELCVGRGEMLGLIGANGAGKTTLVKCLTGIIPVTQGSARLLGRDCFALTRAEKQALSLVMGQRSQLWWDIPAFDSFRLLKEIYQIDAVTFETRVREHAERLGVAARLQTQLRQLSLGERMKMEIIGAFLHDPVVVFLDEPTIGLDLISQETIRTFLRDINRARGVTIVLTSHDMADIEETCDRLVILDQGTLLFDGDLSELQRRLVGRRSVEVHLEPGSRGFSPEQQHELDRFGARLVREAPLALTFEVPSARARPFIQHLFDLYQVRDLADAFMMIWLGHMWRLGRDLKDGKLDPFRVRPASTLFLYAFQQFSLEGCVNMSMALGYLIYGAGVALGGLSFTGALLVAAGIVLCCWVRVVVVTLFSILEFWLLGSDTARFIGELFHAASDRPVDIFGARMRTFLLFIVPVGALTQIPASIVLGRYSPLEGLLASVWLGALGLLVFAGWNRSFRRYESALG